MTMLTHTAPAKLPSLFIARTDPRSGFNTGSHAVCPFLYFNTLISKIMVYFVAGSAHKKDMKCLKAIVTPGRGIFFSFLKH